MSSGIRFPGSLLAAALALAAAVPGCGGNDSQAKPKAGPGVPVPVLVAVAETRTVPLRLGAVGNVETQSSVAIRSRVDGQIVKVHFKDGDDVAEGQPLFQIDPRPFEAQLRQAEANLLKDQAQLDYARGQETRYQDLLAKGFVSKEAYAQVRATLDSAQAAVAADGAAIESAKLQLQYATLRAPISGRAGKVLVTEGNVVKANETPPLVVINQLAPIYVSFAVAEQHGPAIRAAMRERRLPVSVAVAEKTVTGELAFVDNAVDPTTGTLKLRARFANKEHLLWPGDFVEAALVLGEQAGALVVPSAAVQSGPKGSYVFVVKADDTADLRPVKVARSEGGEAVIAEGLAAGERVVTDGASRLTRGAKVSIAPAKGA
ncbi:MAG TPA: efflux RND transporter periplasmic adaptor subunit [Burkholderiales bacterium]|nr:efflux RND transporter periplasmic adaptor subunit [Burkholderiales bacterium]